MKNPFYVLEDFSQANSKVESEVLHDKQDQQKLSDVAGRHFLTVEHSQNGQKLSKRQKKRKKLATSKDRPIELNSKLTEENTKKGQQPTEKQAVVQQLQTAQEDVPASEKGQALCRATDVRYKTCKVQLGDLARDVCIAHVHPDYPENSSHRSTFGNVSYADYLSSLLILSSCALGLQMDALIDSDATNNFLSQACFERLAAK